MKGVLVVVVVFSLCAGSFSTHICADGWYGPKTGRGWFRNIEGACEAHASIWQEAENVAIYNSPGKRSIITCNGTRKDASGGTLYVISKKRVDGGVNGNGNFDYYPHRVNCEAGLMPSSLGNCTPGHQNAGASCPAVGNPINPRVGNKFQSVLDTSFSANSPIRLFRFYNSQFRNFRIPETFGFHWRHSYSHHISVSSVPVESSIAEVFRPDGKIIYFQKNNGVWSGGGRYHLTSTEDSTDKIQSLLLTDGAVKEVYDDRGKIVSVLDLQTNKKINLSYYNTSNYDYFNGYLEKVSDEFGNSLIFSYKDSGLIDSINASNGEIFSYSYNENNMLIEVSYSGQTKEIYHYENPDDSNLLTAITDQNNLRFAEWQYDSSQRAIVSRHLAAPNQVVEKVTIDYSSLEDINDPKVTVTNALNKQTTYHYSLVNEERRVTSVEGLASANCAAANKNYSYNSDGLLETKTDWKNNVTRYQYNSRNLETQRTEAEGTPEEKIITTEWHPTLNLPTKITEPKRETMIQHDAQGREVSRAVNQR